MKKIALLLTMALMANMAQAQGWKDKLKAAKEKVSSVAEGGIGKDYSKYFDTIQFVNIKEFASGVKEGPINCFDGNPAGFPMKSSWPCEISLEKDEKFGTVINLSKTKYYPKLSGDSEIVPYYYNSGQSRLYLREDLFITYSVLQSGEIELDQLLGGKDNQKKLIAEIEAYQKWALAEVEGDESLAKDAREAESKAKEAARLAKYGLEGKNVKSIEIFASVPKIFGQFIPYSYYLVATLADGTKISTKDGGYRNDYEVTTTKSDFKGAIESGFLSSDELVITAKVKSKPSVTKTKKISIPYNSDISFLLYGHGWNHRNGDRGSNATIKIKQEAHTVTGEPVLRVRIESTAAHAKLREFSISPNNAIVIDCHGGDGGNDGGHFNGGDGGNVKVIKDPSVKHFTVDYNLNGGKAGGYNASAGRDGKYTVIEQSVTF